ncbi:MAG TPA: cyclic-di-AMP receptor [Thermomicrobiales bacterium]|nr:cyclic-di-AMP receptor [Thermomicrobiales bacterium]
MKLIITVVQNQIADDVVDALVQADYRATRFASTGGFLRRGNTTIMIGVQDDQVDHVIEVIRGVVRKSGEPLPDGQAAATVFVLDLEEYQRL